MNLEVPRFLKGPSSRLGLVAFLALWLSLFLFFPFIWVIFLGFCERGPYGEVIRSFHFDQYLRLLGSFADGLSWNYIGNSIWQAFWTTFVCAFLSIPFAIAVGSFSKEKRWMVLMLLMIPYWTSFIIRVLGLKLLWGKNGVFALFSDSGFSWVGTPWLVWIGMITNYFPIFALPVLVSLEKVDQQILEAARDLGANSIQVVWKIVLPLIWPGLAAGIIMTAIPAMGDYLIPDLLGGSQTQGLGNWVTEQFLKSRNWPFGAVVAQILILLSLPILWLGRRGLE